MARVASGSEAGLARMGICQRVDQTPRAPPAAVGIGEMHRHEDLPRRLVRRDRHAVQRHALRGPHPRQPSITQSGGGRILRVDVQQGFAPVLRQPGAETGTGHRMPLVAITAGVQPQRESGIGLPRRRGDRHQPCLARRGRKPLGERVAAAPLERFHRVITGLGAGGPASQVQRLAVIRGQPGHRRIFAENVGRAGIGKGLAVAQPRGDIGHDPPLRPCAPSARAGRSGRRSRCREAAPVLPR